MGFVVRISDDDRLLGEAEFDGRTDLGRQEHPAHPIYVRITPPFPQRSPQPAASWRINIADWTEVGFSRSAIRLEPVADRLVRITNLTSHAHAPLYLMGDLITAHEAREAVMPVSLRLLNKSIWIGSSETHKLDEDSDLQCLIDPIPAPGSIAPISSSLAVQHSLTDSESKHFVQWFARSRPCCIARRTPTSFSGRQPKQWLVWST